MLASLLKGEVVANHTQESKSAFQGDLVFICSDSTVGNCHLQTSVGRVKCEEQESNDQSSDGKVDVETSARGEATGWLVRAPSGAVPRPQLYPLELQQSLWWSFASAAL